MTARTKSIIAVVAIVLAFSWMQWAAFAPASEERSGEWVEIIQSSDQSQCRWELHRGVEVINVGKWHNCTDKELGA